MSTGTSKALGVAAVGAYRRVAAAPDVSGWNVWADEGDHYVVAVFPGASRGASTATFVAVDKRTHAARVIEDATRYRA